MAEVVVNLGEPMDTSSEAKRSSPTALQGWVLVSGSWLAVMAPAIISPMLPRMTAVYRGVAHETVLIALAATLPALFVAILAMPSGMLADRVGSRNLLLGALAIYAVLGTAPYWLRTLPAIVASRAGVGIAEAVIITCSTALLGDYFSGDNRARWLALQTGSANLVAIVMTGVSGVLGEHTWRAPFLAYGLAALQLPLVAALIWEPRRTALEGGEPAANPERPPFEQSSSVTAEFRWRRLLILCVVTVFASTAFYVVVVQLGFLLAERGTLAPKLIGQGTALAILSLPVGAALSRVLRIGYLAKLGLSFLLSSLGFFVIASAHGFGSTVLGGVITDFGSGLALPTLITWALASVPALFRGRATGAWQAAFAFGQFASPLVVIGLASLVGGRAHAVFLYGLACGVTAVVVVVMLMRSPGRRGGSRGFSESIAQQPR